MKLAIMQPYFLPYIGYFQLINSVDKFVVYDNIKFTKSGWINRNRILANNKDEYISLPIKKGLDSLSIHQRFLADTFDDDKDKLLRRIEACYKKAPHYKEIYPLIRDIISYSDKNLFGFLYHSLEKVCAYLNIRTQFITSSTIEIEHELKSQDKVIAICKKLNAKTYINPIGGSELYNKKTFAEQSIELHFLKPHNIEYHQFGNSFVPWLSVLDIMMFNSYMEIQAMLNKYELI